MNPRVLAGCILLVSIAGCDQMKSSTEKAETPPATPATAAAVVGSSTATPKIPAGVGAAGAESAATPGPSASVGTALQNGDKKLAAGIGPNGAALNLQNDGGKGAIHVNPSGATSISGKGGTIVIPGAGGLPGIK